MKRNARQLRVVNNQRDCNRRPFDFGEREPLVALGARDTRFDRRRGLFKCWLMRVLDPLRDVDNVRQRRQGFDAALPRSQASQREVMLER